MPELNIKTGYVYLTRDDRTAMVYGYNTVHHTFSCVVVDREEFFTVHQDGRYFESRDSHNDLVEEIK